MSEKEMVDAFTALHRVCGKIGRSMMEAKALDPDVSALMGQSVITVSIPNDTFEFVLAWMDRTSLHMERSLQKAAYVELLGIRVEPAKIVSRE